MKHRFAFIFFLINCLLISCAYALNCPSNYLEYPFNHAVITLNDEGVQCWYRDNINQKNFLLYIGESDPLGVYYLPGSGPWFTRFRAWECDATNSSECQFNKFGNKKIRV